MSETHHCTTCGHAWQHGTDGSHSCVDRLTKQRYILMTALREIADRGPLPGYTSAGALRLGLVVTQTIARDALARITEETL